MPSTKRHSSSSRRATSAQSSAATPVHVPSACFIMKGGAGQAPTFSKAGAGGARRCRDSAGEDESRQGQLPCRHPKSLPSYDLPLRGATRR